AFDEGGSSSSSGFQISAFATTAFHNQPLVATTCRAVVRRRRESDEGGSTPNHPLTRTPAPPPLPACGNRRKVRRAQRCLNDYSPVSPTSPRQMSETMV